MSMTVNGSKHGLKSLCSARARAQGCSWCGQWSQPHTSSRQGVRGKKGQCLFARGARPPTGDAAQPLQEPNGQRSSKLSRQTPTRVRRPASGESKPGSKIRTASLASMHQCFALHTRLNKPFGWSQGRVKYSAAITGSANGNAGGGSSSTSLPSPLPKPWARRPPIGGSAPDGAGRGAPRLEARPLRTGPFH
jgi:hypothetical protein